jgi:hypothetical protein
MLVKRLVQAWVAVTCCAVICFGIDLALRSFASPAVA